MKKFMGYRLRAQTASASVMLLATALMVALAVWGYFPPVEGETQPLEKALSVYQYVARILGIRTLAAPTEYVIGVCFTVLLPLVAVLFQWHAANASMIGWISSGEAQPFLLSPRSKGQLVFAYWLQMLLWGAAQALLTILICFAAGFVKQKWQINLSGLVRVSLSMWCFSAMTAGLIAFFFGRAENRLPFKAAALLLLFGAFRAAANFKGITEYLRFATPFSLMNLWDAFYGKTTALLRMPCMPAMGAFCAFLGGIRIEKREFYH